MPHHLPPSPGPSWAVLQDSSQSSSPSPSVQAMGDDKRTSTRKRKAPGPPIPKQLTPTPPRKRAKANSGSAMAIKSVPVNYSEHVHAKTSVHASRTRTVPRVTRNATPGPSSKPANRTLPRTPQDDTTPKNRTSARLSNAAGGNGSATSTSKLRTATKPVGKKRKRSPSPASESEGSDETPPPAPSLESPPKSYRAKPSAASQPTPPVPKRGKPLPKPKKRTSAGSPQKRKAVSTSADIIEIPWTSEEERDERRSQKRKTPAKPDIPPSFERGIIDLCSDSDSGDAKPTPAPPPKPCRPLRTVRASRKNKDPAAHTLASSVKSPSAKGSLPDRTPRAFRTLPTTPLRSSVPSPTQSANEVEPVFGEDPPMLSPAVAPKRSPAERETDNLVVPNNATSAATKIEAVISIVPDSPPTSSENLDPHVSAYHVSMTPTPMRVPSERASSLFPLPIPLISNGILHLDASAPRMSSETGITEDTLPTVSTTLDESGANDADSGSAENDTTGETAGSPEHVQVKAVILPIDSYVPYTSLALCEEQPPPLAEGGSPYSPTIDELAAGSVSLQAESRTADEAEEFMGASAEPLSVATPTEAGHGPESQEVPMISSVEPCVGDTANIAPQDDTHSTEAVSVSPTAHYSRQNGLEDANPGIQPVPLPNDAPPSPIPQSPERQHQPQAAPESPDLQEQCNREVSRMILEFQRPVIPSIKYSSTPPIPPLHTPLLFAQSVFVRPERRAGRSLEPGVGSEEQTVDGSAPPLDNDDVDRSMLDAAELADDGDFDARDDASRLYNAQNATYASNEGHQYPTDGEPFVLNAPQAVTRTPPSVGHRIPSLLPIEHPLEGGADFLAAFSPHVDHEETLDASLKEDPGLPLPTFPSHSDPLLQGEPQGKDHRYPDSDSTSPSYSAPSSDSAPTSDDSPTPHTPPSRLYDYIIFRSPSFELETLPAVTWDMKDLPQSILSPVDIDEDLCYPD